MRGDLTKAESELLCMEAEGAALSAYTSPRIFTYVDHG